MSHLVREIIIAAEQVARDSRGFEGEWVFDPEHSEDHDDFDDRLMYVPAGDSVRDDTAYCIVDGIDQEIAEPMCRMLNWAGGLAREVLDRSARVDELEALLSDAATLLDGYDPLSIPNGWRTLDEQNRKLAAIRAAVAGIRKK